ncbi:NADH-quinone oxidoreductase subunit J [Nocardioides yefusunii]|uniref:NADH-quinone oxidoreductase subunit J n=1 Tax=Nocardioides yefusunii TaxID=2500546 RepID=A0ABW1QYV6_9ACTN|nr:NADH-quinone oxidoreductase subunit J [Nocardioides yefusunii]
MTAFWILAPVMVLCALGILFVRSAVHAALLLAVVMISMAGLYLGLEAPFLFVVQVIVYTGAVLMLFLFVVMLVGVDHSDDAGETIPGQRAGAVVLGTLLALTLAIGVAQVGFGAATGLGEVNAGGNVEAIADLLFSRWVLAFEATSALLVTAAVGAMMLTHREAGPRVTQARLAAARIQAYAETGMHPGPRPAPGVYARSNSVDTPALLPDGSPAPASVPRPLAGRDQVRAVGPEAAHIDVVLDQVAGRVTEEED